MGVGVLSRPYNGPDINAGLQSLLAQGQTLELLEAVLVRGAVDNCVAEDGHIETRQVDGGFRRGACAATSGFGVG